MSITLEPVILDRHRRGDSWEGMIVGPITIDGSQPPYAMASCRMQFRDHQDTLGYEFNTSPETGEGSINIVDPDTWEATVPLQPFPIDAGRYSWDFEITDTNGDIYTVAYGKITIEADVTYDNN